MANIKQRYAVQASPGSAYFDLMLVNTTNIPQGYREVSNEEARSLAQQQLAAMQDAQSAHNAAVASGNRYSYRGIMPSQEDISKWQERLSQIGTETKETLIDTYQAPWGETLTNVPQSQIQKIEEENKQFQSGQLIDLNAGTGKPPAYAPVGTLTPQQSNAIFQASQPKPTFQQSVNGVNIPTGTIPTVGTNGVNGTIGYGNSQMSTQDQYLRDLLTQQQAALAKQQTETSPWRALISGATTPTQVMNEAMAQTGIDVNQYFADQKAKLAELDKLNQDYNNKVAERDQALLASTNKLAPMTFIRGEQALIQNQYAIELNRQSANINSKAAIYEAEQGRFKEAQTFAQQAVEAATATQKYYMDMYQMFYDENQDIINGLSADIRNAFNQSLEQSRWEYEQAYQKEQDKIKNDLAWAQEKRLGGQTGNNQFFEDATKMYKQYTDTGDWGSAWNMLKAKYPNKSNAEIDAALGKVENGTTQINDPALQLTIDGQTYQFPNEASLEQYKKDTAIVTPELTKIQKDIEQIKGEFARAGFTRLSTSSDSFRKALLEKGYTPQEIYNATKSGWESTVENTRNFLNSLFK
jgi:hypothetical protein